MTRTRLMSFALAVLPLSTTAALAGTAVSAPPRAAASPRAAAAPQSARTGYAFLRGSEVVSTTGCAGPVATGALGLVTGQISEDLLSVSGRVVVVNVGTTIDQIAISLGPAGSNGPQLFELWSAASAPAPPPSGRFELEWRLDSSQFRPSTVLDSLGVRTFDDALKSLMRGDVFFEIYTVSYPNGEIRGQLTLPPPVVPWQCAGGSCWCEDPFDCWLLQFACGVVACGDGLCCGN